MYRSNARGWLKHLDFILTDLLCLVLSLVIAYGIRLGNLSLFTDSFYMSLLFVCGVRHVFLSLFFNSYRGVISRGYWEELKATLAHNLLLFLMVVVFLFLAKNSSLYSRIIICVTAALSFLLMYLSRLLLKKIIRNWRSRTNKSAIRALVMANAEDIESTVSTILSNNLNAFNICGLLVYDKDMTGQTVQGVPVVASGEKWKEYVLSNVVDEIFINLSDSSVASDCVQYINSVGATAHMILRFEGLNAPVKEIHKLNGFTVISNSLNIATPRQRFIKRAVDIFFGLIGALAVIVLTIFLAPLIYFEDKGPIFFTQKRVGRNGRVFRIIKYRTMYTDAEARKAELMKDNEMSGHMFKMKDDPRITKIGKFLRKTSLDELPQAFNILAGSMSVVGTRPPTLDEFMQYEPHHKVRLGITPGLTGMWQVSGRSEITNFEEIVRLDEQYIREWSLALDFRIILKTFIVVFKREGAV